MIADSNACKSLAQRVPGFAGYAIKEARATRPHPPAVISRRLMAQRRKLEEYNVVSEHEPP